jgi:hypothetical protein
VVEEHAIAKMLFEPEGTESATHWVVLEFDSERIVLPPAA